MKKSIFTISLCFLLIIFLSPIEPQRTYAQTNIPPGDVSGTWTQANSPYNINGEITIPNDSTLTIEPGVEVVFTGHYKFNVQGRLLAIGTETDTIVFTINDTTGFHNLTIPDGGWHGIRFMDTPSNNDSSKIVYCKLQYGKANTGAGYYDRFGGALCVKINKLLVSHCMFRNNTTYSTDINVTGAGAIAIFSNPIIEFCEFTENTTSFGAAIGIWESNTSPLIRNNYFHHNLGHGTIIIGSWGGSNTSPVLINNIITDNISNECGTIPSGHGIVHFSNGGGVAVLINNTIVNNSCTVYGGGIFTNYSSATPLLINNILYGNTPSQVRLDVTSSLDFYNCLIEGGEEGFSGATFTGDYENCIDTVPQFVGLNDYHLQNTSPCIGAAIDSIQIDALWFYCPPNDFEGNPRPNPTGSMPDIGAYENELPVPVPVELTSFTTSTNGKEVILNWSTATETNNSGFEVERKQNNSGWARIGFVEGHGTTTEPKNYSYIDDIDGINVNLLAYRLKQIDYDGSFEYSDVVYIDNLSPTDFVLHQNFPNPFNPSTKIKFSVRELSFITIKIYDVLGSEVATLVNEEKPVGTYELSWSAANLPSGVYLYRLQAGDLIQTKKMILLK